MWLRRSRSLGAVDIADTICLSSVYGCATPVVSSGASECLFCALHNGITQPPPLHRRSPASVAGQVREAHFKVVVVSRCVRRPCACAFLQTWAVRGPPSRKCWGVRERSLGGTGTAFRSRQVSSLLRHQVGGSGPEDRVFFVFVFKQMEGPLGSRSSVSGW